MIIEIEKACNDLVYNGSVLDKFPNDKVTVSYDIYSIFLDGIILNKKELLKTNKLKWEKYVMQSISRNPQKFIQSLEGSFWGVILNKITNEVLVFNDKIGSIPIYYFRNNNFLIISNSYTRILKYCKQKSNLHLNEEACYMILTYGYTFESKTICSEIKRLLIGNILVYNEGNVRLEKFHRFRYNPRPKFNEKDELENLNQLFEKAVSLSFKKDKEYGYNHLVGLSGGLDSRMTSIVAHNLGFDHQVNFTFSQTGHLDESIAKQIASDFNHEWLFKALDNGNFLKDLDLITEISGGNVLYYGLAHANSLYKLINFDPFGIIHTGQLGDVIFSSNTGSSEEKEFQIGMGAYSTRLIHKLNDLTLESEYQNEEIFMLYIRGFYGANQGLLSAQKYSYTYSPFYNVEVISNVLQIPINNRFNHRLYKKWIVRKHPQTANYKWEKTNSKITNPWKISCNNKDIYLKSIPVKALKKLKVLPNGFESKKNMNPLGFWINNNLSLQDYMDNYFNKSIHILDNFKDLRKDCIYLYTKGDSVEKTQVLSLLSGIRMLFE